MKNKFRQNLMFILFCNLTVFINIIGCDSSKSFMRKSVDRPSPKIINGTVASLDTTRHQVSIRRRGKDKNFFGTGHICGGSLISDNVVLSGAHCFVKYTLPKPDGTYEPDKNFIVVMGNLDRFEVNNKTLVFDILKIVKAIEIFNLSTYDSDIALLMLNGKVPANHPTVRPIILNDAPLQNNTMCQATGWGLTEEGYASDILRSVDLPIIDFYDCRKKSRYRNMVHEGMMCAGYFKGGKDTCDGDSGGPLACQGLQAGIISWGSACATDLLPGVLTEVAYYKDWIIKEVAQHNGTLPKFAHITSVVDNNHGVHNEVSGLSNLNCSLVLVSSMLIINYLLNQIKFIS